MSNQGAVRMHNNAANVAARVASKYAIVPGSVPSPIKIARSRAMRPSIMLQTVNVASDIKSAASIGKIRYQKNRGAYWWFLPVSQRDAMSQEKIRSRHLASQEPHKGLIMPTHERCDGAQLQQEESHEMLQHGCVISNDGGASVRAISTSCLRRCGSTTAIQARLHRARYRTRHSRADAIRYSAAGA